MAAWTIEQHMAERAYYAALPCQGFTTFTEFPIGGNGISRDVPCGYVFSAHGDSVRCVPCELRRQDALVAPTAE